MIDKEITLICTDNNKKVQGHILAFNDKEFISVAVNTVRIKLNYKKGTYAGSMGGYEFSIKEEDLPKSNYQFKR